MILSPRSRRPLFLSFAIGVFFFFFLKHSRQDARFSAIFDSQQVRIGGGKGSLSVPTRLLAAYDDEPSPQLIEYWTAVLDALMKAEPRTNPIKLTQPSPDAEDNDPNIQKSKDLTVTDRIEHVDMPASEREIFKSTHAQMAKSARQLGPRIPYQKHSKGIVMTAGGKYMGNAMLSLTMLRRAGSKLPVQLFIDGGDNSTRELCETRLFHLGIQCRSMDAVFSTTPYMPRLKKFQYKVFSLLFSSFDDVLFMDADCYPLYNPDHLFDADPYKSYGLVTWPDIWTSTVSPTFYEVAGISNSPTVQKRRTSESGVIMIKRSTHAEDLILSTYYNFYGPEKYYRLLSQGSHGEGDKETFLHAAIALDKPFWDVHTTVGFIGRWINSTFEGIGMKQADPVEDFKLWSVKDRDHATEDKTSLKARFMFIHHNIVKIDVNMLHEALNQVLRKDTKGQLTRFWGDQRTLTKESGYDVEKAMWDEVIKLSCNQTVQDGCDSLRSYYKLIFSSEKATYEV